MCKDRYTGRIPCDNKGRDWNTASQGMPRTASNHQKVGRGKQGFSCTGAEAARPCQQLDFRLAVSRTVGKQMCGILGSCVALCYDSPEKLMHSPGLQEKKAPSTIPCLPDPPHNASLLENGKFGELIFKKSLFSR